MAITRGTSISKPQQQQQQQESTPLPPLHPPISNNINQQKLSHYEQTREQRIKENRERLQKLGIVDLSIQLTSIVATSKTTPKRSHERRTPLKLPLFSSSSTPRRSSRLQNAPPVTYTEPKEDKSRKTRDIVLEEGAKPEVYTEEHEKLLGNTEMPWTFGVDGCRADGTRIYDPVSGKTCHQCRQKTLGLRTRCSKCSLVQGQFCGDCLIARYGEHVVEANQNPNWICPPCRGICNCSLCRQSKGWYPTGAIYRTINKMGYKSVAHYLIATKRAPPDSETSLDSPQPAKRSLPFEGMEVPNDNEPDSNVKVESAENNVTTVETSVKATDKLEVEKASVGRPKNKAKIETNDAENVNGPNDNEPDSDAKVESAEINVIAIETSVQVTDKLEVKRSVGRPRKKPKIETNDVENVIGPNDNEPDSNAKVESAENNVAIVETSVKVTDKLEVKKRSVGRPRKKPEIETNDAENVNGPNASIPIARETMETSEAVSTIKNQNLSDSREDSVARRLRSSNKT